MMEHAIARSAWEHRRQSSFNGFLKGLPFALQGQPVSFDNNLFIVLALCVFKDVLEQVTQHRWIEFFLFSELRLGFPFLDDETINTEVREMLPDEGKDAISDRLFIF